MKISLLVEIILVLFILTTYFASANLSQNQIDIVVSELSKILPNCPVTELREFVLLRDCEINAISTYGPFWCGDEIEHTFICQFGSPYLDGVPLLVNKNEYINQKTEIRDSKLQVNNNSPFSSQNFFNFNFVIGLTIGITIALISWVIYLLKVKNKIFLNKKVFK